MKDFLSHIALSLNPLTEEHVIVGLLGVTKERDIFFSFSKSKTKWAIKHLDVSIQSLVLKELTSIQHDLTNQKSGAKQLEIYNDFALKYESLEILSNYTQSTIKFLPPKVVASLSESFFQLMYNKIIGNSFPEKEKNKTHKGLFKKEFISKLKGLGNLSTKVDLDYKVESSIIPFMYKDVHVDLIYKNGVINCVNAIGFDSSIDTIQKHFSEMNSLVIGLEEFSDIQKIGKPSIQVYIPKTDSILDSEKKEYKTEIIKGKNKFSVLEEDSKINKQLSQVVKDSRIIKYSDFIKESL